jgi:hypothetical protein
VDDERPVVIVLATDEAPAMPVRPIPELHLQHPAVGAHDRLELRGGGMQCDLEQVGLGVRSRHPRHGPHLRVAQLAPREGRAEMRQLRDPARHPHLLPGRRGTHAAAE